MTQNHETEILRLYTSGVEEDDTNSRWTLSFSDLISVCLAFFILLFSMSQIESKAWHQLAGTNIGGHGIIPEIVPSQPVQSPPFKDDSQVRYARSIIDSKIASSPILSNVAATIEDGAIIITIPANSLFDGDTTELSRGAEEKLYVISELIKNTDYNLEITAYSSASVYIPLKQANTIREFISNNEFIGILTIYAAIREKPGMEFKLIPKSI